MPTREHYPAKDNPGNPNRRYKDIGRVRRVKNKKHPEGQMVYTSKEGNRIEKDVEMVEEKQNPGRNYKHSVKELSEYIPGYHGDRLGLIHIAALIPGRKKKHAKHH